MSSLKIRNQLKPALLSVLVIILLLLIPKFSSGSSECSLSGSAINSDRKSLSYIDFTEALYPLQLDGELLYLRDTTHLVRLDLSSSNITASKEYLLENLSAVNGYFISDNFLFVSVLLQKQFLIYSLDDLVEPVFNDTTATFTPEVILVENELAYVLGRTKLRIYNVSVPQTTTLLGELTGLKESYDFSLNGNYLYLASTWNYCFGVVNISNPTNPEFLAYLDAGLFPSLEFLPYNIIVYDSLVFISANNRDDEGHLLVVNVSQPINPTLALVKKLSKNNSFRLTLFEGKLFVGIKFQGIAAIDISRPFDIPEPFVVRKETLDYVNSLIIVNNSVYFANGRYGLGTLPLSLFLVTDSSSIPLYPFLLGLFICVVSLDKIRNRKCRLDKKSRKKK